MSSLTSHQVVGMTPMDGTKPKHGFTPQVGITYYYKRSLVQSSIVSWYRQPSWNTTQISCRRQRSSSKSGLQTMGTTMHALIYTYLYIYIYIYIYMWVHERAPRWHISSQVLHIPSLWHDAVRRNMVSEWIYHVLEHYVSVINTYWPLDIGGQHVDDRKHMWWIRHELMVLNTNTCVQGHTIRSHDLILESAWTSY